ncbi:hypothetical protein DSL92_01680 [Billgrantia gudaonensis]|uniref:L-asparaginase N-terminal domain-containing protein n=1 Tax=Billgrantia gudaonensis TaxID=376427 RepID=A0A432JK74_9GAMM|nr:hypothetical protein DSL92_01680 [Halomonas gudaonensis]
MIIVHGTDTIEETSYFLHLVIQSSKPVVLTLRDAPRHLLDSDGPQKPVRRSRRGDYGRLQRLSWYSARYTARWMYARSSY